MSNYSKTTDFATKDTLPTGNSAKIVKGTEIDAEFNALETAVNSKSDKANPTFTGTLTAANITATGNVTVNGTIFSRNMLTLDASVKTAGFTAAAGNVYLCNTTSSAFTATLPASPSAGDMVGFIDYAATFSANNLTIARNGNNIDGAAQDIDNNIDRMTTYWRYTGASQGWVLEVAS